ncbi:MAG: hypothetical protein E2582_10840 [Delftia sp.]|nr:hypothetical protein [Delftia sp.]
MLQTAMATVASALLLASCGTFLPTVQPAQARLIGDYRMDCQSIRASAEMAPALQQACENQAGKPSVRIRQDDSGNWSVLDLAGLPLSPHGEWKLTVDEGNACINAPFLAVCRVSLNTPVFKNLNAGVPISSSTGYVLLTQGLIADLIKVEDK